MQGMQLLPAEASGWETSECGDPPTAHASGCLPPWITPTLQKRSQIMHPPAVIALFGALAKVPKAKALGRDAWCLEHSPLDYAAFCFHECRSDWRVCILRFA